MSRIATLTRGSSVETFTLSGIEDWSNVAKRVRPVLMPGSIVTLSGPLGAGKTTFVQILAKELGVQSIPRSPTFTLMRAYRLPKDLRGITRIVHIDAYRIEDEKDLIVLDLDEELADNKTVLLIEWPEHIPKWLESRKKDIISIKIEL